jgi:hypothetical protein
MIESPQGGNTSDPGGNEMESDEMKESPPIGQDRRCKRILISVVENGFQEIGTPPKNGVPARDYKNNPSIYV